jgi:NDP-sugar pyrophosphorylase family protein
MFDDAGNVWEVLPKLEDYILSKKKDLLKNGYSEKFKNVFVGKNVKIDDHSRIEGCAIIGDNAFIGHSAYLRDSVLIGENVHIGHAVEVKHSVVLQNTAVAHFNYIGDSVIGSNANIGGGVILANWRFDEKSIEVRYKNKKIDTGLTKFGVVIGDKCKIGSNAVLNPGTILEKNVFIYPLVSVRGTHEKGSIVK